MTHIKWQNYFHQLRSVAIICSSYYIHSPRVDEINFCHSICVMDDGPLHVVIKRKVFKFIFCSFSTIFYGISISDTCLRSQKSITIPNFDKIPQYTAEI